MSFSVFLIRFGQNITLEVLGTLSYVAIRNYELTIFNYALMKVTQEKRRIMWMLAKLMSAIIVATILYHHEVIFRSWALWHKFDNIG